MSEENPYASPSVNPPVDPLEEYRIRLDGRDQKKAEAVVKDAGQFWLAIILCVFCSGLGSIIVPIWYTARLMQWSRLANKYPDLMAADVPKKSFQAKFQSSQWKLITGLIFGCFVLGLVMLYVVYIFYSGVVPQPR